MPRDALLHSWMQQNCPHLKHCEPASSDASFRRFFRLFLSNGTTQILMDIPPEKESTAAFLKVARILNAGNIAAPKILKTDEKNGILIVSDLGRIVYLEALKAAPESADHLMQAACSVLIDFQKISRAGVLPPYSHTLLMNEMQLFIDWFLKRHLNFALSESEEAALKNVFHFLSNAALNQPKVFVHRDFMPRNLMLPEAGDAITPALIDFQDAVYGPITYDVVSLFRDAFISWEEEQELDWVIRYWEKARAANLPVRADFARFWQEYEWMGLQRHLKVLGIFCRLNYRDGKTHYIADLPRFLNYALKVAGRYAELSPLLQILKKLDQTPEKTAFTF